MQHNNFEPIGFIHSTQINKYDSPRQGVLSKLEDSELRLEKNRNFEQALDGIEDFERIWLVYLFDRNENWNPKVRLPRDVEEKKGVFATRSPYRPNPIGFCCVSLIRREGLSLFVAESDLLDGTPVLDIKPYIDYSDSFVTKQPSWLDRAAEREYRVLVTEAIKKQFLFITKKTKLPIEDTCIHQLSAEPLNKKKKRVDIINQEEDGICNAIFSYRTWRVHFSVNETSKLVVITKIHSGYTLKELGRGEEDPYLDKAVHKEFNKRFE